MANVKRTTRDSKGNVLYTVLMTHASHASAAGRFQTGVSGSLIIGKESCAAVTTVRCPLGDVHRFEEL